jgi:hypothetical protein
MGWVFAMHVPLNGVLIDVALGEKSRSWSYTEWQDAL